MTKSRLPNTLPELNKLFKISLKAEKELRKFDSGNESAGKRARALLKELRKQSHFMANLIIQERKILKEFRMSSKNTDGRKQNNPWENEKWLNEKTNKRLKNNKKLAKKIRKRRKNENKNKKF